MGNNARRKERQRMKRQKKNATVRRMHSGSPYRVLSAGTAEVMACYINADWKSKGIATIHVLKRLPGGSLAIGAFLVDLWCIGLKDCYGRLNASHEMFDESMDRLRGRMEIQRIDPSAARRMVIGGIRFARQNGFRLPARYERWVAILGNASDWQNADLCDFGREDGTLCYVGELDGLRSRLIGCSVDEFLAREDVHFLIGGPVSSADDYDFETADEEDEELFEPPDDELVEAAETDEAMEELSRDMHDRFLDGVRKWCFANNMTPHQRLGEAINLMLESLFQIRSADIDDPEDEAPAIEASQNMADLLSIERPDVAQQLSAASWQLQGFVNQFNSPEELIESLGLPPIEDAE